MSEPGSNLIQGQWNLLGTGLLARDTILSVLRACAEEDVQGQAVLALEGLGFGLLVDEKRREEGLRALRTFRSRVVHQLRLSIGLARGGLAVHMSQSQNLIASFLVVCACKVCFRDETTAEILYEMMKTKGIYDRVPVMPRQVARVVSTVSAYSENLDGELPAHVFSEVLQQVERSSSGPGTFSDYIRACPPTVIADVLCEVFTALQDADVKHITIKGMTGAVWLITFFLWLCPNITEFFLDMDEVAERSSTRLSIYLTKRKWEILVWRSAPEPSKVLLKREPDWRPVFSDYYPVQSAKTVVASTLRLKKPEVLESIGQLAGVLLEIALSKGRLETELDQKVPLIDICCERFLNSYPSAMEMFGWVCDDEFYRIKGRVRVALEQTLEDHASFQNIDTRIPDPATAIKHVIRGCYNEFSKMKLERMLPVSEEVLTDDVADHAIHLATEVLLKSFVGSGLQHATFRPPEGRRLGRNAGLMRDMLFRSSIADQSSYRYFRAEAIAAAIPGSREVEPEELVVVSNGYIAYPTIIESISGKMTDQRSVSEIQVVPGSLRMTGKEGDQLSTFGCHFESLVESVMGNAPGGGRLPCARFDMVQGFDNDGRYCGFQALSHPNMSWVEFLVTASHEEDRKLLLRTVLHVPAPKKEAIGSPLESNTTDSLTWARPIPVFWFESMQAIAFARHVTEYNVVPEQMRKLAHHWRDKGYLGENMLAWIRPGHVARCTPPSTQQPWPRRCISVTYGNEILRFFEAGYFARWPRLYVRHAPPLEQCLKAAFEEQGPDRDWAILI